MKQVLSCIIAMLLCLTALPANAAEPGYTVNEIREQITSPWKATYETKRRTIEVDVLPTVPDVQTMPVLMVRPAFWVPSTEDDVSWSAYITGVGDSFAVDMGNLTGERIEATRGKNEESLSYYLYAPLDIDKPYAPDNDLTIRKMIEVLTNFMDTVKSDHFGIEVDQLPFIQIGAYVEKGTRNFLLPAMITITLNTTVRHIPIYGHVIESVDTHKDNELYYDPNIIFQMRSQESFSIIGKTVYETAELAKDVPLCSFEMVRDALEEEINAGYIRKIYSVDLGYALYNVSGTRRKPGAEWIQTAEFYAAPTWRCVCLYSNRAKKDLPIDAYNDPYTSLYYKTIYVNAQTGKLIDPNNGKRGCGDYPGIITWEEVK